MVLCQTCLGPLEVSINLFESPYEDLLEVLQRLLAFQVQSEGSDFSVCCFCHGKLISIFEFQNVCLKSLEPLQKITFVKTECHHSPSIEQSNSDCLPPLPPLIWTVDAKVSNSKIVEIDQTNEEASIPLIIIADAFKDLEDLEVDSPFGDNSDGVSDYQPEEPFDKKRKREATSKNAETSNYNVKSQKISLCSEVEDAIKEVNNFMSEVKNARCIFCEFVGVNAIALRIHMKRQHKDMTNWCERCNLQTDNLQDHREIKRCHIWQCKFCLKDFMWIKTLRKHLRAVHGGVKSVTTMQNYDSDSLGRWREDCDFKEQYEDDDDEQLEIDETKPASTLSKRTGKRGKYLARIPRNEVLQAIKEARSYSTDVDNRQCTFCDFFGVNAFALRLHMKRMHGNIKDWCKYCNMQVENLQGHKTETKCYLTQCKFCLKRFGNKENFTAVKNLLRHYRAHGLISTDSPSQVKHFVQERYDQYPKNEVLQALADFTASKTTCIVCRESFETSKCLTYHMRKSHKSSLDSWCKKCNLLTEDLRSHLDIEKCIRNRCIFCNRSYCKPRALASHLKLHYIVGTKDKNKKPGTSDDPENDGDPNSQQKEFFTSGKCTVCHKSFYKLELHMIRVHSPNSKKPKNCEGQCLCPICGKVFHKPVALEYHMSIHSEPIKKFKCNICNRLYRSAFVLKRHEKIHKYSFICHICGKHSMAPITHKKHMETHEEGPARCDICDKVFTRPGRLKLHMRQHTGENQYNCIPCGRSFHIKSLLRYHMRIHNDERPFKCSYCGKCFGHVTTLQMHEQAHAGVKKFKCNICPYKAVRPYALTIHMKQHPEDAPQANKPHKCLLCPKSFSTNSVLLSHKENCHAIKAK